VAILGSDILSAAQGEALRHRRIDVGLARPPLDTRELHAVVLFEEAVVAVLPASHALASRERVSLRELGSDRVLLHDRDLAPGIYDKILELYDAAGVTPHIVSTAASPASASGLIQVASGKGIYIGLGGLRTLGDTPGVAFVRLDEPRASLPIYAVWRASESSPVVLQFIDSIRRVFQVESRVAGADPKVRRSSRKRDHPARASA
jgi:DNA-binding transcriptional LysR family regulator